jgi:hypothetical protein
MGPLQTGPDPLIHKRHRSFQSFFVLRKAFVEVVLRTQTFIGHRNFALRNQRFVSARRDFQDVVVLVRARITPSPAASTSTPSLPVSAFYALGMTLLPVGPSIRLSTRSRCDGFLPASRVVNIFVCSPCGQGEQQPSPYEGFARCSYRGFDWF